MSTDPTTRTTDDDDDAWIEPWQEGYDAFRDGREYGACPYQTGERRVPWQEGWTQASADKETDGW